jgi:anti-sigma factor RsiW
MNCAEAEQFFDAYVDGELSGSLRLEFDAHRLRCPLCQQKLAMMEACEHVLARDGRAPAPARDFTDRVMQEVHERRVITLHARRRRRIVATAAALPAAAAVLLFAILGWGYGDSTAAPGSDRDAFVSHVRRELQAKNRVELTDLLFTRLEQAAAARSNLKDEFAGLVRYAPNLWVVNDLSPLSAGDLSPWGSLMQMFVPAEPEEPESTADTTGPFSL